MANCVNPNHPEIISLSKKLGIKPATVATMVGVWQQNKNIIDRFPTSVELLDGIPPIKYYNLLSLPTEAFAYKDLKETYNVIKSNYPNHTVDIGGNKGNHYIIFYQMTPAIKKANDELNGKMKQWLQKIGVTTINVDKIRDADGNPINAVAAAKMLARIVEVVEGKAGIDTLPEEAAHFFVEMLKDNALMARMMEDIVNYPVYQEVKEDPNYIAAYGKNEELYRKEAIGKLIANNIVKQFTTGSIENDVKAGNWWNRLWQKIKSIFLGKLSSDEINRDISPYESIAKQILIGDVSAVDTEGLKKIEEQVFYQMSPEQGTIVNNLDSKFNITYDENAVRTFKGKEKKGAYVVTKDNQTKVVERRVSDDVEEYIATKGFAERTAEEKKQDEVRRKIGTIGHNDISNIINRKVEALNGAVVTAKTTQLHPSVVEKLESYFDKLISSYPAGTKFYSEKIIYDEKSNKAGTIDLLVVQPDGKVDIYDWKFIEFKNRDISGKILATSPAWYKQEAYNIQLSRYRQILRNNYGVTKFGKARIIPISTTYNKDQQLVGFEIANEPFAVDPEKPYLNPVPIMGLVGGDVEYTNDTKTNELIEVLLQRRADIINKVADGKTPEEVAANRAIKAERIERINQAIKDLQLDGDVKSFLSDAVYEINYIVNKGIANLSVDELVKAKKLLNYYADLEKNDLFADAQVKKYAPHIAKLVANAGSLYAKVNNRLVEVVKEVAASKGVTNIDELQPETGLLHKLFATISQSNHPVIKTFYKLVTGQKDKVEKDTKTLDEKIANKLDALKKWGAAKGLKGYDVFNSILQFKDGKWTGNLISQWNPDYFKSKTQAISSKDTKWFEDNTTFDNDRYQEIFNSTKAVWEATYKNQEEGDKIIASKIEDFERRFNVNKYESAYFNKGNYFIKAKEKWRSNEWKNLQKPENKPLLEFYNLFTETIDEFKEFMPLDEHGNFIPNIKLDLIEQISQNGLSFTQGLNSIVSHLETGSDTTIGMIDELTGERKKSIPVFYTKALKPEEKSRDLGSVLLLFGNMAYNYKYMAEIEGTANMLQDVLASQKQLITTANGKTFKSKVTGKIAAAIGSADTLEQFQDFMNYYLYGIKTKQKDLTFSVGGKEISGLKTFSKTLSYYSAKSLTLNLVSGLANGIGGLSNSFFEGVKGRFYTNSDFRQGLMKMSVRDKKAIGLTQYFKIDSTESSFKDATKLSVSGAVKNLTLDKLYVLQRSGDWLVENGVLQAMLRSHTLKDGKIVKKQGDEKSLYEMAEIKDDKVIIDGLSEEEYNKFRRKVKYLYSEMKGNSNNDDINGIRLSVLGQSLMQFRNWIPRMAYERFGKLRYVGDLETYERGKYMSFLDQTINKKILPNILSSLADAGILGFGKGMIGKKNVERRARELYQDMVRKAAENNESVKITEQEFVELHMQNVRSTVMELQLLATFAVLLASLKGFGDDDDEWKKDPMRRFVVKLINRNMDEVSFWFNPDSASSILKKPIPIVSFASDITNFTGSLFSQSYGFVTQNEELMDKSKPKRYFNKLFPISNSLESLWAAADPDYNKKE